MLKPQPVLRFDRARLLFWCLLFVSIAPSLNAEIAPADKRAVDESTEGIELGLDTEVALFGSRSGSTFALGVRPLLGWHDDDVDLVLQAPLYFQAGTTFCENAATSFLRCDDYQTNEAFDYTLLSRVITLSLGRSPTQNTARSGEPTPAHGRLRISAMRTTLGHGGLVDALINAPVFDQRQHALYATLQNGTYRAELWWAGLLRPTDVSGARLSMAPFGLRKDSSAFFRRLRVGLTYAGDFSRLQDRESPLVGGALDVFWPLNHPRSPWQFTPRLVTSSLYGLSRLGAGEEFGVGAHAGARLDLRFNLFALRLDGRLGVDSAAHRTGVFSPLYLVLRDGGFSDAAALKEQGSRPGLTGQASLSFVVKKNVQMGARFHRDQNRNNQRASLFADVAYSAVRASAFININEDTFTWRPSYASLEASWNFFGPFSATARWLRAPRKGQTHDDLAAGIAFRLLLQ